MVSVKRTASQSNSTSDGTFSTSDPALTSTPTNPSSSVTPDQINSLLKLALKAILITFLIWLALMVITIGGVLWWGYRQMTVFTSAAGTTPWELRARLEKAWHEPLLTTNGHKNILVLGVDSLAGRGDVPPLTDTMMIVSLDVKSGHLTLLPLPRDLWSEAYQTKINALYAYGRERYPTQPERFPQEALSEMTGVPFHHVVVLSIDQVAELIDLLGGIDVKIETSFVDEQFPRPDVDVRVEHDPAKLYQRVEFIAGTEHMNGERALQYIRSRHASGTQGSDDARSRRQELVLAALTQKLQEPETYVDLRRLGLLFKYYQDHFNSAFSLEQGVATVRALWPVKSEFTLQPQGLSIYPTDPQGSLVNPPLNPRQYQGQWVYTIRNSDQFKTEIQSKLFGTAAISTPAAQLTPPTTIPTTHP